MLRRKLAAARRRASRRSRGRPGSGRRRRLRAPASPAIPGRSSGGRAGPSGDLGDEAGHREGAGVEAGGEPAGEPAGGAAGRGFGEPSEDRSETAREQVKEPTREPRENWTEPTRATITSPDRQRSRLIRTSPSFIHSPLRPDPILSTPQLRPIVPVPVPVPAPVPRPHRTRNTPHVTTHPALTASPAHRPHLPPVPAAAGAGTAASGSTAPSPVDSARGAAPGSRTRNPASRGAPRRAHPPREVLRERRLPQHGSVGDPHHLRLARPRPEDHLHRRCGGRWGGDRRRVRPGRRGHLGRRRGRGTGGRLAPRRRQRDEAPAHETAATPATATTASTPASQVRRGPAPSNGRCARRSRWRRAWCGAPGGNVRDPGMGRGRPGSGFGGRGGGTSPASPPGVPAAEVGRGHAHLAPVGRALDGGLELGHGGSGHRGSWPGPAG